MSHRYLLALVLASLNVVSCKAKAQEKKQPATAEQSQGETNKDAELSAEQEKAITKEFITRFTDAIDADDATRWAAVVTKERAARYQEGGIMDKVYAAWRKGTATVSDRIRKAPFRLEKSADKLTLHFEGVIVANDPEAGYAMTVRIEDGKMYLDEN